MYLFREMDALEDFIRGRESVDESTMRAIEEKFELLVPYFQSAKNTGLTFISESHRVSNNDIIKNIQLYKNVKYYLLSFLSGNSSQEGSRFSGILTFLVTSESFLHLILNFNFKLILQLHASSLIWGHNFIY